MLDVDPHCVKLYADGMTFGPTAPAGLRSSSTVGVEMDIAPLLRILSAVERQVPFASAVGLTRTVQDAQAKLRSTLKSHFEIRSTWVSRRLGIQPAKKTRLVAAVGHRDQYMKRQADGGRKVPHDGSMVAIPVGIRKMPSQRTGRGRWPGRLIAKDAKDRLFLDKTGLWRRIGKGVNERLKLLYLLRPSVNVPKRWPFAETARAVFVARWRPNMRKALLDAVADSMPKRGR